MSVSNALRCAMQLLVCWLQQPQFPPPQRSLSPPPPTLSKVTRCGDGESAAAAAAVRAPSALRGNKRVLTV
jgi:hypothetical protein